jgi:hypothetical protein
MNGPVRLTPEETTVDENADTVAVNSIVTIGAVISRQTLL